MVKSNATSVMGLIRGMNCFSYHSRHFDFTSTSRVSIPATKGTPR